MTNDYKPSEWKKVATIHQKQFRVVSGVFSIYKRQVQKANKKFTKYPKRGIFDPKR